ncbi:MAG: hypothetical protein H6Q25_926 [Bacteroidetes bacterium]|nr:hypothetical protein [Bacteroidota bacterium]
MDSNNKVDTMNPEAPVVNCFQNCIFAWILTTLHSYLYRFVRCELLSKLYLCMDSNNTEKYAHRLNAVVNCFQNCIFAWILTTKKLFQQIEEEL